MAMYLTGTCSTLGQGDQRTLALTPLNINQTRPLQVFKGGVLSPATYAPGFKGLVRYNYSGNFVGPHTVVNIQPD